MISRLRLITFDVTDTLLKFRAAPGQQYGEIGAIYGVKCDTKLLGINFKDNFKKMDKEHPNYGLYTGIGWELWWKMVVRSTFKDTKVDLNNTKLDEIAHHLIDMFKTSACWQLCYGAPELLSYIRSRGIPMGIISNFDPRLSTTLVNTKIRHYFQFVLTSYEVGVEKPDTKIFGEAINASKLKNLKPEECMHVGDKTILDYHGAKNSGWHAVLINEKHPKVLKEKYPNVDVNHVFSSLYHFHKYLLNNSNEKLSAQSLC